MKADPDKITPELRLLTHQIPVVDRIMSHLLTIMGWFKEIHSTFYHGVAGPNPTRGMG